MTYSFLTAKAHITSLTQDMDGWRIKWTPDTSKVDAVRDRIETKSIGSARDPEDVDLHPEVRSGVLVLPVGTDLQTYLLALYVIGLVLSDYAEVRAGTAAYNRITAAYWAWQWAFDQSVFPITPLAFEVVERQMNEIGAPGLGRSRWALDRIVDTLYNSTVT